MKIKEEKRLLNREIEHITNRIEEYEKILADEPDNKEAQLALKKFKAERAKLMGE